MERRGLAGLGEDELSVHARELGEGHLGEGPQVLAGRAPLLVALRAVGVRLPLLEPLEHAAVIAVPGLVVHRHRPVGGDRTDAERGSESKSEPERERASESESDDLSATAGNEAKMKEGGRPTTTSESE